MCCVLWQWKNLCYGVWTFLVIGIIVGLFVVESPWLSFRRTTSGCSSRFLSPGEQHTSRWFLIEVQAIGSFRRGLHIISTGVPHSTLRSKYILHIRNARQNLSASTTWMLPKFSTFISTRTWYRSPIIVYDESLWGTWNFRSYPY
jgi:hypothetical protein